MILITIDAHKNILMAQFTVIYEIPSAINEVSFLIDRISFNVSSASSNSQLKITFPDNLFLLNSVNSVSCDNLLDCITDHESVKFVASSHGDAIKLSFRVRLVSPLLMNKSIKQESEMLDIQEFFKGQILCGISYNLFCASCSHKISTKEVHFQSVSVFDERALDLSENWFCHAHDSENKTVSKREALFIGCLHFYISEDALNDLMITKDVDGYACLNCSSILSRKRKIGQINHAGFYCEKIIFQEAGKELAKMDAYCSKISLISFFSLLKDVLKSNLSCKMYLENKQDGKISRLLLWANSEINYRFLHCVTDDSERPNNTELSLNGVYKVLYLFPALDSEVVKQWKKDFDVEYFEISDTMLKSLKSVLNENLIYDTDISKSKDEFSIGYIPTSFCYT